MKQAGVRAEILEAGVEFINQPFATPLQLSSGLITELTEARAWVAVRVGGREAVGRESIYLSDLWAWPDPQLSHAERDRAMRTMCERLAANLAELCGGEAGHPLQLGLRLHHSIDELGNWEIPSILARVLCASPFDAAIHDAAGLALGVSAFDFYHEAVAIPEADSFFEGQSVIVAIAKTLVRPPRLTTPAWWVVNKNDQLDQTVGPAIRERGYRCFKLKTVGTDTAADVERTVEVFRKVREYGVENPALVVDSNEANPDAASVLDFLMRLREADAGASAALAYLEQPTGRDIRVHKYDWSAVSALKPVMLDEGLTSLDLLNEARAQGWPGLALKTCKGHSFTLTAAAWAVEKNMLLSLQDLTNPGLAAIHAMLLGGHLPTINGVELNSPQFTPAANADWLPRLSPLFEPRDGIQELRGEVPQGLGSRL